MALPILNGVCIAALDADTDVVADLLGQVAATSLPHSLLVRPDAAKRITDLAVARGMTREQLPLMVLDGSSQLGAVQATDELVIRELAPTEAHIHAQIVAAGFEKPVEPFLQLMTPACRLLGVRAISVKSMASRSLQVSVSRSGRTSGSSISDTPGAPSTWIRYRGDDPGWHRRPGGRCAMGVANPVNWDIGSTSA